jgi:predicted DNA-binding transcriptional regulator AlpA
VSQTHEAAGRRFLTPAEVAERLAVSRTTLRRWARDGLGPRPVKFSSATIRYDALAVERWERALAGDPS